MQSVSAGFFVAACLLQCLQPSIAALLRYRNLTDTVDAGNSTAHTTQKKALDGRIDTTQNKATEVPRKLTGLLCREPGVNGTDDLDVVIEEGGRRSLLFSKAVKNRKGEIMGREVAGMQSTVHCATQVGKSYEEECLPADLSKPVPTCSAISETGRCSCVAVVNEPLKLLYQQEMVSATLELCQAKARLNQPFRVLMFGLGGGAVPMYLRHRCESAYVESVEHDARVALVAQRLFGFRPDGSNKVEIADGEEAATRRARTNVWPEGPHYDVVLVDCFNSENHVATSCRSERFVTAVHNVLSPGGQVMQNVMDGDETVVMPMYRATFGQTFTEKRVVQKGQLLVIAKTHIEHHP
jgi:hypothetical protein